MLHTLILVLYRGLMYIHGGVYSQHRYNTKRCCTLRGGSSQLVSEFRLSPYQYSPSCILMEIYLQIGMTWIRLYIPATSTFISALSIDPWNQSYPPWKNLVPSCSCLTHDCSYHRLVLQFLIPVTFSLLI